MLLLTVFNHKIQGESYSRSVTHTQTQLQVEEELQIIETKDDDYCDNTSAPRAEIAWTEAAGRPRVR